MGGEPGVDEAAEHVVEDVRGAGAAGRVDEEGEGGERVLLGLEALEEAFRGEELVLGEVVGHERSRSSSLAMPHFIPGRVVAGNERGSSI